MSLLYWWGYLFLWSRSLQHSVFITVSLIFFFHILPISCPSTGHRHDPRIQSFIFSYTSTDIDIKAGDLCFDMKVRTSALDPVKWRVNSPEGAPVTNKRNNEVKSSFSLRKCLDLIIWDGLTTPLMLCDRIFMLTSLQRLKKCLLHPILLFVIRASLGSSVKGLFYRNGHLPAVPFQLASPDYSGRGHGLYAYLQT